MLLKDDVGVLRVRSRVESHDHKSHDHGVTIAFFFDVSFDKQVIVKSYLQLGKKPLNPTREKGEKPVLL